MNILKSKPLVLFKCFILILILTLCGGLHAVEDSVLRLFIAGNSTAKNGAENGWGSHLQKFFNPEQLIVNNLARAGRSSRTFITEGLWDSLHNELRAGDYVFIQFGHNDAGAINDNRRARGSIPALGDSMQEIDNQVTGKHEVIHTFGWYMQKMVEETRAKGGIPIILSMTARNVWPLGRIERENTFCSLAKLLAGLAQVTFIDVRNMIADQYALLGPLRVSELFPIDHTHTNSHGAFLNASIVVSGLKAINSPLTKMLSGVGKSVPEYGPNVFVDQFRQWMTSAWMPEMQPEVDTTKPTLYTIGNSTVRTGTLGIGANGQWGWGAPISCFFDRSQLNVKNMAWGGTSSRTFRTLGFWQKVKDRLKPGDYVIMQFGHNDSGPLNDSLRARGTIDGNGEETEEIDNILTGEHEIIHSYGWYIREYIKDIRVKGAVPIVCSLIPRNRWTDGKLNRTEDGYILWARQAAEQEKAFYIDLNKLITDYYNSEGQKRVTALYFDEGETTHTNALGAHTNANCLVIGIKTLKELTLKDYLTVVKPR
jgi:lysophospholipase L1-like esterase